VLHQSTAPLASLIRVSSVRVEVDEVNHQAWVAVAHWTRINDRILSQIGDPAPGSNFARVADLFPFEKVADRARAYLRAGLDHLVMWADYAAPLKFHPEHEINFTFRPTYTLSRAAIESSSQAVWLMDTGEPMVCVRRHLALMRWDLNEHHRSKIGDPGEQAAIALREQDLLQRVSRQFQADDIKPPRGYLQVIKDACDSAQLELDAATAERVWRAASGAAHGKYWTTLELQTIHVGEEYEPGHHRATHIPNASGMTEALETANKMTRYGVLRFADYSGADIQALVDEAVLWVSQNIPLKEGMSPDELERMRAVIERRSRDSQQ